MAGLHKLKYPKAVRQFALTIVHYSPKTYRYIREKFNRCLPHPSTLKKYYVNSGANGEPGISTEAVHNLSSLVKEFQQAGKEFFCSISFDEIFIRQNVQYIDARKKFQGFITYGQKSDGQLPIANSAIVFMINGIMTKVSLPIAHHFITSLKTEDKANLLLSVIATITEVGARIINVTCDGLRTNFSVFQSLGASLKSNDLRSYFLNPANGDKIFIIFDPCHMLKLVRNCIKNDGSLVDGEGKIIKWQHFEQLESSRVNNDFIRHKLTKRHIECERNKMNVALAAQTLSRSVAKSMEFLMKAGKSEFLDCEGTIKFSRRFNDLFDLLNTGQNDNLANNNNNTFKVPLSRTTAQYILPFLRSCTQYIESLKLNGANILKSTKNTGFLGFIIDITSLRSIYEQYVETGLMDQLATYHMSQDPLESFFGRIRSKCGNNDNPTAEQFKSAYRKILINNEISASINANCKDDLNIFFVSSTKNLNETQKTSSEPDECIEEFEPFSTDDNILDAYEEATICQIASDIERKIRCQAYFECKLCLNVLNENEKVSIDIFEKEQEIYRPCISSVYICKVANKYLNIFKLKIKFDYIGLVETVEKQIDYDGTFQNSDFTEHCGHKEHFIHSIIEEFVRIRATYIAKNLTMNAQDKLLRNKLNKKIQSRG